MKPLYALAPIAFIIGLVVLFHTPTGHAQQDEDAPRTDNHRISYGVGFYLGGETRAGLDRDGVQADLDMLARGYIDGLHGNAAQMDQHELDQVLFRLNEELERRMVQRLLDEDPEFRVLSERNLQRSREFLAGHQRSSDVQTHPSGVQYNVLKHGDGDSPTASDAITITYTASLTDGTVVGSGDAAEVMVDSLRPGGQIVAQLMKVGDRMAAVIPPELAYGGAGRAPDIGPNEVIVVDVELLAIKKMGDN